MREFKIGDEVKDARFGYGVVENTKHGCHIFVKFTGVFINYFSDGRYKFDDPYRSLFHADEDIIVPRPKKKVRIQGWINYYEEAMCKGYVYGTKEMALEHSNRQVSPIHIDTEIEVEG